MSMGSGVSMKATHGRQRRDFLADFVECACNIVQGQLFILVSVVFDEKVVPENEASVR
jgi:hypothetical protein